MKIDASNLMAMRSAILQQNSALQKAAGVGPDGAAKIGGAAGDTQPTNFAQALQSALGDVNEMQTKADTMSTAYEKGETTDIAGVMLAREQATVGFQATLQVRNKLLSAYKDIMSMPV